MELHKVWLNSYLYEKKNEMNLRIKIFWVFWVMSENKKLIGNKIIPLEDELSMGMTLKIYLKYSLIWVQ